MLWEELHVNDDPRRVEDEEGDDDVEENQEQIQLLLQLILWTKSLNLEIIEIMSTFSSLSNKTFIYNIYYI